jgi:FtsP/CotA-like multicopper oxidase with cupredoxin domain
MPKTRLNSGVSTISRRKFLLSVAASTAAAMVPVLHSSSAHASSKAVSLRAAPGRVRLVPEPYGTTSAWCYNNDVPGPEIRVRQGDRLRVEFENQLGEQTTVHWHGVRLPNAMDGVPHLTQTPVSPGGSFIYEFTAIDAGTFWYHPHQRGFEQVGRGLYGPLIVEEPNPVRVDRDVTWVLDDWRLMKSAEISEDFGNAHDMSHNGRVGNTVTINGKVAETFPVQTGERIRLRLINAANARIFGLDFAEHNPIVIAMDGQPVTPHSPENNRLVLGPAMRIDLIIDMTGDPGSRSSVNDRFYEGLEYRLVDFQYANASLRDHSPNWPMRLESNLLVEPDIGNSVRHEVEFTGGMMGGMVMEQMGFGTDKNHMGGMSSMIDMMHSDKMWFINGVAAEGHVIEPLLTLDRGRSYVISMANITAWHHPIHLHGHSFRVVSRNGVATPHREWQDTVLMAPRERIEIALVADNPGDWMFHCHILEHMAAGMMGVIRVA